MSPCRGGVGPQVHLDRGVDLKHELGQRRVCRVSAAQRRPDRLRGARSSNEREVTGVVEDGERRGCAPRDGNDIHCSGSDVRDLWHRLARPCQVHEIEQHPLQLFIRRPVANPHQSQSVDGCRQRDDHLGRERVARKWLDWDAADERAGRQQLRSSRVEIAFRLTDQKLEHSLAHELIRGRSQEGRGSRVGVHHDAGEVGQEQGLGRIDKQVTVRQERRRRTGCRPIGTLSIPEQHRHARLAIELRQADRLDVRLEPDRLAHRGSAPASGPCQPPCAWISARSASLPALSPLIRVRQSIQGVPIASSAVTPMILAAWSFQRSTRPSGSTIASPAPNRSSS